MSFVAVSLAFGRGMSLSTAQITLLLWDAFFVCLKCVGNIGGSRYQDH